MATRIVKRRIAVRGVLAMVLVLATLSGCKKQSEPTPAPTEPNAATTTVAPAAEPNA